jgi:hypothetical protein
VDPDRNGEPFSQPTLQRQLAFGLTSHDCATGGTRDIWVELPKRRSKYRVEVPLLDLVGENSVRPHESICRSPHTQLDHRPACLTLIAGLNEVVSSSGVRGERDAAPIRHCGDPKAPSRRGQLPDARTPPDSPRAKAARTRTSPPTS